MIHHTRLIKTYMSPHDDYIEAIAGSMIPSQLPKPTIMLPLSQEALIIILSLSSKKHLEEPSLRKMGFFPFQESSRSDP